jgi:alanyl-tRNA synthetase
LAAGIRRIEAVAGPALLPYLRERDRVVRELADRFKAQPGEILERVAAQADELWATAKELAVAREELAQAGGRDGAAHDGALEQARSELTAALG